MIQYKYIKNKIEMTIFEYYNRFNELAHQVDKAYVTCHTHKQEISIKAQIINLIEIIGKPHSVEVPTEREVQFDCCQRKCSLVFLRFEEAKENFKNNIETMNLEDYFETNNFELKFTFTKKIISKT
ncbi:hypothetical protein [Dielma fastidiosa]|uniref:hypothetical protein n=1 Tax=Dielma fastidiosa TaxID=1034346 RepID=UPI0023F171A8|nr:hypothetical protein [Dielma fastidiosa]